MKRKVSQRLWMPLACVTLLLATAGPARADVVTYENGRQIRGIVRELPQTPDRIEFTGTHGTLQILRSRIASIERESPSMGHTHIGQAHREEGDFAQAIASFNRALELDPDNQRARELLDQTQADVAQREEMGRQDALRQIELLADQADEAVEADDFERAETLFGQANDLVPSAEQRPRLTKRISQMYLTWGRDRLDKLDPTGAEERFSLAISADSENSEAVDELLALWEDKPEKREQAVNIYETILDRHPENTELRRKLGQLYGQMDRIEDQVHHYLILYNESERWHGTPLEAELIQALDTLHRRYARQQQYDSAINTYNVLASIDQTTDPTAAIHYEYLKRANSLDAEDRQGRLALARFAEGNGLDDEATKHYRDLLKYESTHEPALEAIKRYAARDLAMARAQFEARNYSLAQTLADQVRREYPQAPDIVEEASGLIGRAAVEMTEEQRQLGQRATDALQAGNEFYQTANQHFNNLFYTERRNNPRLISSRQEAQRYFTLAIAAYQEALRLDPTLSRGANSVINVRLSDARRKMAALTQGFTDGIGRFTFRFNQSGGNE